MRSALLLLVVLVASAWSCAKPEYAIPRNGGSACNCSMVCPCSLSREEESLKERDRCFDACSCDPCPGEKRGTDSSSPSAEPSKGP